MGQPVPGNVAPSYNARFNYCLTIFDASLAIRTLPRFNEKLYRTHLIEKYRAQPLYIASCFEYFCSDLTE